MPNHAIMLQVLMRLKEETCSMRKKGSKIQNMDFQEKLEILLDKITSHAKRQIA